MEPGAFVDKGETPQAAEVATVLGPTAALWDALRASLTERLGPLTEEWTFSGKAYGWALRLKQGKRAVLYLTPCAGCFRVALALSERAVAAAPAVGLPAAVLETIAQAPRYPEGRAVRLEVRRAADLDGIVALAALRMAS